MIYSRVLLRPWHPLVRWYCIVKQVCALGGYGLSYQVLTSVTSQALRFVHPPRLDLVTISPSAIIYLQSSELYSWSGQAWEPLKTCEVDSVWVRTDTPDGARTTDFFTASRWKDFRMILSRNCPEKQRALRLKTSRLLPKLPARNRNIFARALHERPRTVQHTSHIGVLTF